MSTILLPQGETDLGNLASLDTNTLVVPLGNQTVTTGLDQSGLAAGIGNVDVQGGSSVSFVGSSGAALKATITGTLKLNGAGGDFKYTPVTTTAVTCPRIQNLGGNHLYLMAGGSTPVVVKLEQGGPGAQTDIDDQTKLTTLAIISGSIDQQYHATLNTSWYCSGGSLTTGRGWSGTARIGGSANVTVGRNDNNITNLPTGATCEMGGGTLTWRGGNLTTLNAFGGMCDFRSVPVAMTITNLTATWDVVQRSYFKSSGPTNLVTITNLVILGGPIDAVLR